jgi:hypothetical protein
MNKVPYHFGKSLLFVVLTVVLYAIAAHADKPTVIKDSEAIHYVGKEVEVHGRAARA